MAKTPLIAVALLSLVGLHQSISAAPHEEVMRSRYMKYNFCMEARFGQGWRRTYQIAFGMNRWGVSEPTETGIAAAPAPVKGRDAECRKLNEIAGEARARREQPEKNNPD